ncbi:MAG: SAM-dependent methyltransferase [Cyanobium sp.]
MTSLPLPDQAGARFSQRVREGFGRRAAAYDHHALLQQATAWRLGRLCRDLPLGPGPRADLGAGSGLLSRALLQHLPQLGEQPPLQLDLCPELLARNPLRQAPSLLWDLNLGLPSQLQGAALLASSFSLQWLDDPGRQLALWCRQLAIGGWLCLAVPTSGSFPQWHRAARAASVPCTALGLPAAATLIAVARRQGLALRHQQLLRFSRPEQGGLETLRHLRQLGASASRLPPLTAGQLRRLLRHWPDLSPLAWEVLLLIGQRPNPTDQNR